MLTPLVFNRLMGFFLDKRKQAEYNAVMDTVILIYGVVWVVEMIPIQIGNVENISGVVG